MQHLNVAIDGPAGAGKSTVAKAVAAKLGIRYLDTGAMYRAVALYAIRAGVGTKDEAALTRILPEAEIRVAFTDAGQRVYLGEEDVTGSIRTQEISMGASDVSAHPCVRDKLSEMQRAVGRAYDVVMDGRDITTNVLPDTPHKFFITASPEERARRRFFELQAKGKTDETYENVLADLIRRDAQDSSRAYKPLVVATDAVVVDTTHMTADEAAALLIDRIRAREAAGEAK